MKMNIFSKFCQNRQGVHWQSKKWLLRGDACSEVPCIVL
uniref:Uncharacterized protein n=1 Tax=Anguilla anguilla TaxID=7936 RepID=A0A0E9TR64_ANGAN